jgi:tetratricopeptide (TPR) repeat protein
MARARSGWDAWAGTLRGALGITRRRRAAAEAKTAQAEKLVAAGRHAEALQAYEDALRERPGHYPAGFGRAMLLLDMDPEAGRAALDALSRAQPQRLNLYKRRFELHLDAGRFDEAKAVLQEAGAALPGEQRLAVFEKRLTDRRAREQGTRIAGPVPTLFPRVVRPGIRTADEITSLRSSLASLERHALRERTFRSRDLLALVASDGELEYAGLMDRIRRLPIDVVGPALAQAQRLTSLRGRPYCALARVVACQELAPGDAEDARTLYRFIQRVSPEVLREIDWIQFLLLPPDGGADRAFEDLTASGLANGDRVEFALLFANLMQARAQSRGDSDYRDENLHALNSLYGQGGFEALHVADGARPLATLQTAPLAHVIEDGPLVSVLMTTFNADHSIDLAMRSVLDQSWRNLELIVIDDCSEPASFAMVQSWEARDSRVRVLRNERNQGTYVSKNRGLAEARGEFVTCHDSDDWSHPRKIETQVESLVREQKIAGYSRWARCSPDLRFEMFFGGGRLAYYNLSSMMYRRAPVTERVGYFDSVRTGADSEYRARVELAFNEVAVEAERLPLSFGQVHDLSLTATSLGRGWFSPDRLDYRSAWRRWHNLAKGGDALFVPQLPETRAFAVAESLRPDRRAPEERLAREFDRVLIGDFRINDGSARAAAAEIDAAKQSGERIAVCQLTAFGTANIDREFLASTIQDRLSAGLAERIHLADKAEAGLVEIYTPGAFDFAETMQCGIRARAVQVIPEFAQGEGSSSSTFDPARVTDAIARHFGQIPAWLAGAPAPEQA